MTLQSFFMPCVIYLLGIFHPYMRQRANVCEYTLNRLLLPFHTGTTRVKNKCARGTVRQFSESMNQSMEMLLKLILDEKLMKTD